MTEKKTASTGKRAAKKTPDANAASPGVNALPDIRWGKALLREFIDCNPYPIAIADRDGFFVMGNRAFHALLGDHPPRHSIFDDPILKKHRLLSKVRRAKKGESVVLPDVWCNPHDHDEDWPDRPICLTGAIFPLFDDKNDIACYIVMQEDVTARVRAAEALRQSEAKYRSFIENLPETMIRLDVNFRYTFANKAFYDVTGLTEEQVIGHTTDVVRPFFSPADYERLYAFAQTVLKDGKTGALDLLYLDKDGNRRWMNHLTYPHYGENGKIDGIEAVCRDITDKKESELRLRKAYDELETRIAKRTRELWIMDKAIAASPGAIAIADIDGKITFCNRAFARLRGRASTAGAVGRNIAEVLDDPDAAQKIRAVIENGGDATGELTGTRDDGTIFYALYSATAAKDETGAPLCMMLSLNDISERRAVEEQARAANEFRNKIFQNVRDAIIVVDKHYRIVSLSDAAVRIFGFSREELTARSVRVLLDRKTAPRRREAILELLKSHDWRETEMQLLRKGGEAFPALVNAAPLFNKKNDFIAAVFCIHDIGKLRRLEKAILDIETRERQRIGHDLHDELGQLLTGVAFLAQRLELDIRDGREHSPSVAAQIAGLANQAIETTRRLAMGAYPLTLSAREIAPALRDLVAATGKRFGLTCTFTGPDATLELPDTIASQLFKIAQEAVNNAVRHSGSDVIAVSLNDAGNVIVLEICDRGRGFAEPVNKKGIGLEIMRYRANMIGAALDIENRTGGGTVVSCTLGKTFLEAK